MRSTSAPPNYNHNDTMAIQSVDIIELAPAEQGMKLSVENEINSNHIDMESAQATLKEAEQEGQEEDSKRNVSNTNTLSSIICVVAGTGILAIAHALSQSGWIGLVYLIASACMSHFTGIILIKCLYAEKCQGGGRLKDYADIGFAAFGKSGQVIGWVFSQAFLFLTPTIYMILASENISDILAQNGFIWLGRTACIWLIAIIIGVPFILVRNMKDVSFLSTFASLCTVCLLLVVCVVSMSSDYTEKIHTVHHDMAIPKNIPIAFSTFSFSYCGHVIYPHLEASMITPKRWSKVLLVSTCVISIMYFTMGLVCYLVFGDHVQSPIYKSLPVGSSQNIAMFVITVHVILVIPFYLYVFTTRIESWLKIEKQQENATSKIMRTSLRIGQVVVCGILAMFIPYFSDFMALVGTILSDTLSFVLPSIFWLKLNWYRSHKTDYEAIVCFIVAMVGVFCATFGTIDAAKQLYHDYVR
ncbi:TATA-binding protein (TBP) [Mucor velutinosus]|uniref:TATA-binding protein (TBP) n=1 Tax=Mucor velutinosus TaxID=708070 RepID=A0AAN7DIA8_9FUNG|nr:TATA-binding protein (TBP) [Mucor velutinosus]